MQPDHVDYSWMVLALLGGATAAWVGWRMFFRSKDPREDKADPYEIERQD